MSYSDITMNIFSQIGIIMLIGLVAKNGILIVEFANQKQEAGEDKMSAIKDAALQRLRPILMTSAFYGFGDLSRWHLPPEKVVTSVSPWVRQWWAVW